MPETPIEENGDALSRKYDVGAAPKPGEWCTILPKTKTQGMEGRPKRELRLRVTAAVALRNPPDCRRRRRRRGVCHRRQGRGRSKPERVGPWRAALAAIVPPSPTSDGRRSCWWSCSVATQTARTSWSHCLTCYDGSRRTIRRTSRGAWRDKRIAGTARSTLDLRQVLNRLQSALRGLHDVTVVGSHHQGAAVCVSRQSEEGMRCPAPRTPHSSWRSTPWASATSRVCLAFTAAGAGCRLGWRRAGPWAPVRPWWCPGRSGAPPRR